MDVSLELDLPEYRLVVDREHASRWRSPRGHRRTVSALVGGKP